jgi:hypothetical protein
LPRRRHRIERSERGVLLREIVSDIAALHPGLSLALMTFAGPGVARCAAKFRENPHSFLPAGVIRAGTDQERASTR